MKSYKAKYFIFLLFSLVLILASVFTSQKSSSSDKSVSFGYPISFVRQDFSDYDPNAYYQAFSLKRENAQTEFLFGRFLVSLSGVFLGLSLLIYVLEIIDFKIRKLILGIIAKYKKRTIKS